MTDFDSLPHERQLPILLELANKALSQYSLPPGSKATMSWARSADTQPISTPSHNQTLPPLGKACWAFSSPVSQAC